MRKTWKRRTRKAREIEGQERILAKIQDHKDRELILMTNTGNPLMKKSDTSKKGHQQGPEDLHQEDTTVTTKRMIVVTSRRVQFPTTRTSIVTTKSISHLVVATVK